MNTPAIDVAGSGSGPGIMGAARGHRFGPPEAIAIEDMPLPAPGKGEVLVRVEAAGVRPWDGWMRAGRSVLPQPLPLALGSDPSGVVAVICKGVPAFVLVDEIRRMSPARTSAARAALDGDGGCHPSGAHH